MPILVTKTRTKMLSGYDRPVTYGGNTIPGGATSKILRIEKVVDAHLEIYEDLIK